MISKTLYKKDTKGKIRFLTLSASNGEIIQESGLLDGNPVEHRKLAKAKNIGKSNETTVQEQAIIEVKAKITKKIKEGYFESQSDAETVHVIKPMLAKSYEDVAHKIIYPCFVQPKLDGMRCLDDGSIKKSREGGIIENMNHIQLNINLGLTLDGELYVHGESFQTNMKYIKKYRKGLTERIKYYIYDIIVNDAPFSDRVQALEKIADMSKNVIAVPTKIAKSFKEVQEFHKYYLSEGYEGTIIRWGNTGYEEGKRSQHLVKYKDFHDIACEVIDVLPSDADPEIGVVHCKNDKGTFGCGMKFSHKERKEILENKYKYIGQTAEIRFFEYTDDGIPRFPVCVGFRLDK